MHEDSFFKIFIIILLTIMVLSVLAVIIDSQKSKKISEVNILTNSKNYSIGDTLKVFINNNSDEDICFSSCYPYLLERNNGGWKVYSYVDCPYEDIVEKCVKSNEVRIFEMFLPSLEKGFHRIIVPVCVGCNLKQIFQENQRFYSNEFMID